MQSWLFQRGSLTRSLIQWRDMPSSVRVNVRNTLIEYMTTSVVMSPCVYRSAAIADRPMMSMPLWVTRRLESWEKRCGIQESSAMLARTRGPSRNPAWAATKSKAASATSDPMTRVDPNDQDPHVQVL